MTIPSTPGATRRLIFTDERSVLRASIGVTVFIAAFGIAFGLLSRSASITFDGVYSLADAGMSILTLIVANLISSYANSTTLPGRLRERFTMGFWHLEPMVLALNGVLLIGVSIYALITAVGALMQGGRPLEFDIAIVYALVTLIACAGMAVAEKRANKVIRSDFVALDERAWTMSAGITGALLLAFCIGYAIQGTQWDRLTPYIDPAILTLVCLVIIPLPVGIVRRAFADILLVTPEALKQHVDEVAQSFVAKYGYSSYRAYVARVGRQRLIELYFIVPKGLPARTVEEWDRLRDTIGEAIGGDTPDRWLTISFTTDLDWAE